MSHQEFLKKFTIGDLVQAEQDVKYATTETTVDDALATLHQHKLLSLPILDSEKNHFIGIVNLFDIVVATAFGKVFDQYDDQKIGTVPRDIFEKIQNPSIYSQPVADLLGLSEESKTLWAFKAADQLQDLLEVFSKGVHRVIINFSAGKSALYSSPLRDGYIRILSQTDIVRFLRSNAANLQLSPAMSQTLAEAKLHSSADKIVSIASSSSALTAFQKLVLTEMSALAVVDKTGALVGTISTSDLRGTTRDKFKLTLLPILDFLGAMGKPVDMASVTVTANATVLDCIDAVLSSRVHRVWVLEDGKPTGVVSLSDIIRKFSPFDFKQ